MKMNSKGMTFFKTGAWILLVAGFAHALIAAPDAWMQGAFSPASDELITVMKTAHVNIVDFLNGNGTSIIGGTAWGSSIGFAIAVGVEMGFVGLILLLAVNFKDANDARNRRLLYAALGVSAVMTVVAALFYFWFPLTILAASLICFTITAITMPKGATNAAR
jgi:hypothetical protein